MDRGRPLEDRNIRSNNRTPERRIASTAIVREIKDIFPIFFERKKLFTTSSAIRTSSPEVRETNEGLECGGRSAVASN